MPINCQSIDIYQQLTASKSFPKDHGKQYPIKAFHIVKDANPTHRPWS